MAKTKTPKSQKPKYSAAEKQLFRLSAERDIENYTQEIEQIKLLLIVKQELLAEARAWLKAVKQELLADARA